MDVLRVTGLLVAVAVAAATPRASLYQGPAPDGAGPAAPAAGDPAVIRVDALVTDRRGRPVVDLQPSDFELRVNGVLLPLAGAELRSAPRGPDGVGLASPASKEDARREAARAGTRVFAFVLDEFHVAPGEPTLRVREDVARFVDEQMRPADLALVLKPLDQLPRMRFTRDRAALRATITSFEGRKGDYAPRSAFEEEYIGRAPAAVQAARAQIVTVMLTELALQLGELGADRATVVLVSDGFPRVTVTRRQRIPDLQGVVRAASRYHFSVYTLSPSDVTAEAGTPGATLQWLAEQTGGRFTSSAGTFAPGLARLAADLETYYALTFQPSSSDGRFHQIELRARRPGLEVRARPGFWAPLSSELRALMSGAAPSAPVRSLRRSALIDAWIGIRAADDGQVKVNVSWVPSAIANASRGRPAPSRVELSARSGGRTMYEGALAPAVVEAAGPARFDAPPGTLELNMRVLAADGSLLDTDTRDLPVPDLTRSVEPMALPVELLRARSARQFRDILDNPDAPPTSARAFSRAERLVVRVPIWQGPGAPIPVSVRVVNRGGAPMRILEPLDGSGRGLRIFDLPLAWLAPGEYAIEILLPGQRGEIRDRVSFRVTG